MEVEGSQLQSLPEVKIEQDSNPDLLSDDYPEMYHEIYNAYKEKDYDLCVSFIDKVKEDYVEYKILKSACLIMSTNPGKENLSEAHKILDVVLKKDTENPYTLYAKGLAFYHDDKWSESIEFFKRAVELDPDDMERAELMLGRAQAKIHEKKRSIHGSSIVVKTILARNQARLQARKKIRSNLERHKAAVQARGRNIRIVRRFGCDICDHFFGKKVSCQRSHAIQSITVELFSTTSTDTIEVFTIETLHMIFQNSQRIRSIRML